MRLIVPAILVVCGFASMPEAAAQEVRGRVYDAESRAPVAAVEIQVHEAGKQKLVNRIATDSAGRFAIKLRNPGKYNLQTQRLGYAVSTSADFAIKADELIEIELALSVQPVAVEAVRITARSMQPNSYLKSSGFYDRQEIGLGRFLTRADFERNAGVQMSNALSRVPGVRLVRVDGRRYDAMITRATTGRRCMPAIVLDGVVSRSSGPLRPTDLVIDDLMPATQIEGVEIYNGPAQAPAEFSRHAECGAIVIWTKRRI